MKKTIKIKFIGFQSKDHINGIRLNKTWLYKTLEKNFNIVECEDADYVICSCFNLYEYCGTKQIRIMYSGENYVPDYNVIDYSICCYPIDFCNRNFYLPASLFGYDGERRAIENRQNCFDKSILKTKTKFANLIASYDSENNYRSKLFNELSKYKFIDSPGKFLKNCDEQVRFQDDSKINFQKRCKFSLCIESAVNAGFNTEKIMDAFYAETIPVYYGDPEIVKIFNPKAFINASDYATVEDVVKRIIEIDNDDDLYIKMLNEPIFNKEGFISDTFKSAEDFLVGIFETPLEKAGKRSKVSWALGHEEFLVKATAIYNVLYRNRFYMFLKNIYRKIKKTIK
ncbi:MAG: hypothetical protein E7516_04610 [Ruminococcaceae bacterium]|nr:hypothetical protein [Oscillospiraceae bacterium]